jgi:diaminohydroxyphosphoribosylaminopyrimidine deaminase / 5-amino-6-(5-phosphoribosylamino)uracil reductase
MMFTQADYEYMSLALRLAEQGLYTTTPNPRVGCIIVNHGQIIGQGAHLKAGEAHAEIMALQDAEVNFPNLIQGADVYVTLEPCSHFGKTPPCAEALIKAGVKRVIAAMQDPNPQVVGNGLARLAAAGIKTEYGLMEVQAKELNAGFISRMIKSRPFVRVKIAASLDGKTALANGESKWITGETARQDVQHWRARSCAILTGIETVLADDPQMNVRHIPQARQPLRVVVDSQLRISPNAKIIEGGNTLIAYVLDAEKKAEALNEAGAALLHLSSTDGKVCLKQLLSHLAESDMNEVMVEAGQTLNGALLALNLVDEFVFYYAPSLLGSEARSMFSIPALDAMKDKVELNVLDVRQFGQDIRIRAKPISKL